MKLKSKSFWIIMLLSISLLILINLVVLFIIEPRGYLIIIALPIFFTIIGSLRFFRANNKNFKTLPKIKTRVFF